MTAVLSRARGEFPIHQTHRIPTLPGNRMELSSEGKGWRDLYVSLATEQSWAASMDAVEHFCLAYCVSGSAHITRRIEDGRSTHHALLRPGFFGSIPAGAHTEWRVDGAPQVMLLYLRSALLGQVVDEVFDGNPRRMRLRPILGEAEPLLEQLSLAVLRALRTVGQSDRLYVDSLANALAVQAVYALTDAGAAADAAQFERQPVSNAGIARVVEYIEASLGQDLDLDTLSAVARYSPHFFAKAFKRHMGEPLHQYVLKRRIARATSLLVTGNLPISQIALETGFSSQSHLTTSLRRLTGSTPAALRRAQGRAAAVRRA